MRRPLLSDSLSELRLRGVPIRTILDVGVHTSTPGLVKAFPDIKHVLFEPIAEFYPAIAKNYREIDHEIHGVAVSDRGGEATLEMVSNIPGMNISHAHLVDVPQEGRRHRKARVVTLDEFLAARAYEAPFLLKIDVDGAELAVLRGATRTLRDASVVMIECPRNQMCDRIHAVAEQGFTLYDLVDPCYYDNAFWQCDAILLRRDIFDAHFMTLTGGPVMPGMYTQFETD